MAQAGVTVGGTRLVYQGTSKEGSISVSNPDKNTPYLIQSWVDNFQETNSEKVPFIITPPLFRLDAGQENVLRVVYTGNNLPQDRESVFWLNIKSIPSSAMNQGNQLQITIKTKIKLFYRPANLPSMPDVAYQNLKFTQENGHLHVHNPTPYYISFYSLSLSGKEIKQAGMVAPDGDLSWSDPVSAGEKVSWTSITDFGGISEVANATL